MSTRCQEVLSLKNTETASLLLLKVGKKKIMFPLVLNYL